VWGTRTDTPGDSLQNIHAWQCTGHEFDDRLEIHLRSDAVYEKRYASAFFENAGKLPGHGNRVDTVCVYGGLDEADCVEGNGSRIPFHMLSYDHPSSALADKHGELSIMRNLTDLLIKYADVVAVQGRVRLDLKAIPPDATRIPIWYEIYWPYEGRPKITWARREGSWHLALHPISNIYEFIAARRTPKRQTLAAGKSRHSGYSTAYFGATRSVTGD